MDKWWIKLFRQFTDRERYDDVNVSRVFLHLLLTVNHKEKKRRWITVKRGEIITSTEKLSWSVNLSIQQVKTVLKKLKKTNEIVVVATSEYTSITLVNYWRFQDKDAESNQQITSEQPASNQQVTTTKECKNEKKLFTNVNNRDDLSDDLKKNICDFISYRWSGKRKMTEKAVTLFVNKIVKLTSKYQETEIIEMIEKAIMSWRLTIYEPKNWTKQEAHEAEGSRDNFNFG